MFSEDGKKSLIILLILTCISTVSLGLRLLMRGRKSQLGLDDWLLCGALALAYAEDAGAFLIAFRGGEGKPMESLTPDELEWFSKMFYWSEIGYGILISTIKLAILKSYLRIFQTITWLRWLAYILGTLTLMWAAGHFFTAVFQCTPINKVWRPTKPGHCINIQAFFSGDSISNAILDWPILLLPIVPVWKLQMSTEKKVFVLGSFSLGSIACAASTVRAATTLTDDKSDVSLHVWKTSIWAYIEPNIGTIAACLPFLANTFSKRLQDFVKSFLTYRSRQLLS